MNNYLIMDYHMTYLEEASFICLDAFIKEKQNKFLEEIKANNEKGSTYNIMVSMSFYKHIASIHFTLYMYSGGAHDIRFDKVYYYDLNQNKEMDGSKIFVLNEEFLEILSKEAYQYLKKEKPELIYADDYLLKDGLRPTKENFGYLILENDSLKVIFPPYQVGPWSSGEIIASISYQVIADYLKI